MGTHTATFTFKVPEGTEEMKNLLEKIDKSIRQQKEKIMLDAITKQTNEIIALKKEIERLNLAIAEFSEMDSEVKIAGKVSIPEQTKVSFNGFEVQWKGDKLHIDTITKSIQIEPIAPNRILLS